MNKTEIIKEGKVLDKMIDKPMGDDTIHKILPKCPIILYNQLPKYQNINQILPKVKSYAIILYLDGPNTGHWTAIMKPNESEIEYFDSYGHRPDEPLSWVDNNVKLGLGIKGPYLSNLLKGSGKRIIWNKMDFQNPKNSDVSTCGRHCCFRIQMMKNRGMNIKKYCKMMQDIKKQLGATYDELVTIMISPECD